MDYRKKYIKYKSKYLKQKGARKSKKTAEDFFQKYSGFMRRLEDEMFTSNLAQDIHDFFFSESFDAEYFSDEHMHILEDKLMEKFIASIANGIVPDPEIKKVATLIKRINGLDFIHWYS